MKNSLKKESNAFFYTPEVLRIQKNTLQVRVDQTIKMYNLSHVIKVHLYHQPHHLRRTPFSCAITFKNGEKIWVMDTDHQTYSQFVYRLHLALGPYIDSIRFLKTTQKNTPLGENMSLLFTAFLLVLFSPLFIALYLFRIPISFTGSNGIVTRWINRIDDKFLFLMRRYKPMSIPEDLLPAPVATHFAHSA
jgi:hypothetical protein